MEREKYEIDKTYDTKAIHQYLGKENPFKKKSDRTNR